MGDIRYINKQLTIFIISIILSSVALLLYSYTQVDLNLTLLDTGIVQSLQKIFQKIGYYQRLESTIIYCILIIIYFFIYIWALILTQKRLLTEKIIIRLSIVIVFILIFSYPAFSYDMFNYMFTAKTVVLYQKNPYLVLPRQFTGVDSWLSFMRWTHLPSAYTPLWILMTLPAYIFGFGYFLPVLWNIKFITAISYILTVWYIGKTMRIFQPSLTEKAMVIFAFNPLIIIECLVSSHNDIVMMAFVSYGIFLISQKRFWCSYVFVVLSIALKLMTIFLLPYYLYVIYQKRLIRTVERISFTRWLAKNIFSKKVTKNLWLHPNVNQTDRILWLFLMSIGLILVISKREILPWYWVWIMPFIALLPEISSATILSIGISFGLLFRYVPYLYLGFWDDPVPTIKIWVTGIPIILSLGVIIIKYIYHRRYQV